MDTLSTRRRVNPRVKFERPPTPTSASLSRFLALLAPLSLSLSFPQPRFPFPLLSDFNAIVVTRSFSLSGTDRAPEECFLARNLCRQFSLFLFSDTRGKLS